MGTRKAIERKSEREIEMQKKECARKAAREKEEDEALARHR